jgi:heme-degrading monooxygenase HmoA
MAYPLRVDLAAMGAEEYLMRYTRISTYDMTKGTFDELTELCEKGILPIFASRPGFVNFGLADIGDHKVISLSIWETREAAQNSANVAATWVKENMSDRVRLVTTQIGDLALFHGVPVAA